MECNCWPAPDVDRSPDERETTVSGVIARNRSRSRPRRLVFRPRRPAFFLQSTAFRSVRSRIGRCRISDFFYSGVRRVLPDFPPAHRPVLVFFHSTVCFFPGGELRDEGRPGVSWFDSLWEEEGEEEEDEEEEKVCGSGEPSTTGSDCAIFPQRAPTQNAVKKKPGRKPAEARGNSFGTLGAASIESTMKQLRPRRRCRREQRRVRSEAFVFAFFPSRCIRASRSIKLQRLADSFLYVNGRSTKSVSLARIFCAESFLFPLFVFFRLFSRWCCCLGSVRPDEDVWSIRDRLVALIEWNEKYGTGIFFLDSLIYRRVFYLLIYSLFVISWFCRVLAHHWL